MHLNKIEAIKAVREKYNMGLVEAKTLVETVLPHIAPELDDEITKLTNLVEYFTEQVRVHQEAFENATQDLQDAEVDLAKLHQARQVISRRMQ